MGRFLDILVQAEPIRNPGTFFLTDPDADECVAYSFLPGEQVFDPALAEVHAAEPLRFVPVDWNKDFDQLEQKRNRRCDGYLRSEDASKLIFVELKNRSIDNAKSTKSWVEKAIKQLRLTIVLFRRMEQDKSALAEGGCHRAYVCNPKGPYQIPDSVRSVKKMFLTATRNFVLYCNNKIDLIHD